MPIYSIQAPNGRTYEIEGPEGASQQDVINEVMRQYPDATGGQPQQPTAKPKAAVSDLGYSALSGLGSVVQFPGQLYGLATGNADNSLSQMGKSIKEYAGSQQSAGLKARQQAQQEAIKKAGEEGFLSEAGTAISTTLKDPVLLGNMLAENIVNLIPAFGATRATLGVGMRMAAKEIAEQGLEGEAKKAAMDAARMALTKKAEAAAVGTAVAQQGADVGAQAYTDVYDNLKKQGASDEDAAAKAISLARAAGATGAVISFLSTKLPGARALEQSFAGAKGLRGATTGALKGFLGEAASEGIEEGGGALARNAAMAAVDPTQNIMQGVGAAVGQGALLGGVLGGGAGMLNTGRATAAQTAAAQQQEEAAAQQAAQAQQAREADIEAKRADPEYIAGLVDKFDAYRTQIDELQAARKAKSKDPVVQARAEQAQAEFDALVNSPEFQQHKEAVATFKPEMNALRIEKAKAAEDAAAAAAAQAAADLQDPVKQTQLYAEAASIDGQIAELRHKADTAVRSGAYDALPDIAAQKAALQTRQKELQPLLGTRPTEPPAQTLENMQAELQRLEGTVSSRGTPKAGTLMQLWDSGDYEGFAALSQKAQALRQQIAEYQAAASEMGQRTADAAQQQVSPEPVNPMAEFMSQNEVLDAERALTPRLQQEEATGREIAEMEGIFQPRQVQNPPRTVGQIPSGTVEQFNLEGVAEPTRPTAPTLDTLQRQLAQLPADLRPEQQALVSRLQANLSAVAADPARVAEVSDWLYGLRVGQATRPVADEMQADAGRSRDIASMLDALETGKRSETEQLLEPRYKALTDEQKLALKGTQGRRGRTVTPTEPLPTGEVRTAVQRDMFPYAETPPHTATTGPNLPGMSNPQGRIFSSKKAFQKFLGSDTLNKARLMAGQTVQTLTRALRMVRPIEARIAKLEENAVREQESYQRAIDTGTRGVAAADAAHAAAQARLKGLSDKLDKELQPLQIQWMEARNALKTAVENSFDIADRLYQNTRRFGNVQQDALEAIRELVQAKERLSTAVAAPVSKAGWDEMRAAQAAIAPAEAFLETHRAALPEEVNRFLTADRALNRQLEQAILTEGMLREAHDDAREALDRVARNQQRRKSVREERAAAETIIRRAPLQREASVRAATKARADAAKAAAEAQSALRTERAKGESIMAPVLAAQAKRTERPTPAEPTQAEQEEAAAAQRKAEQAAAERKEALPGRTVTSEKRREWFDELGKEKARVAYYKRLLADPQAREKAGVSEASAVTLRDTALRKAAELNTKLYRSTAVERLEARIELLESDKPGGVNEPGLIKRTVKSRTQALEKAREDLKTAQTTPPKRGGFEVTEKGKPVAAPVSEKTEAVKIAEALDKANEGLEAAQQENNAAKVAYYRNQIKMLESGKLPPRAIGPLVRPEVHAGNIRTGTGKENADLRRTSTRSQVTQAGKPRNITATQAVREGNKVAEEYDTVITNEEAQERADEAVSVAREALQRKKKELEALRKKMPKGMSETDWTEAISSAEKDVSITAAQVKQLEKAAREVPETISEEDQATLQDELDQEMRKEAAASQYRNTRQFTDVHPEVAEAVRDGRTVDAANMLAKHGSTPEVRARAAALAPLLMRTKISVNDDVKVDGVPVAAAFFPERNSIEMHSESLSEEDLLHEMTHAATDRTLLAPDKDLTDDQRAAKRELQGMQEMLSANPKFAMEEIGNVREFAAEVYSNPELRAKMDSLGKPLTLWQRFKNIVSRLLGWSTPNKPLSEKASALVDRIMQPSRAITTTAPAAPSVFRAKADDFDFGDLAGSPIATFNQTKPDTRSIKERFLDDAAMRAEYNLADMHVYAVEAMRMAGGDMGKQAEFDIRAAGTPSVLTASFIQQGAPEFYKDAKGFTAIRASTKDAGSEFFKAVRNIPLSGNDAQAKFELMTRYMTAIRGLRVGPEKVGEGTDRAKLQAVVDQVRNDPKLYAPMEAARAVYNKYNEKLVDMAVKAGAISPEEGKKMTAYGDYVPMYREHNGQLQAVMDNRYETIGDIAHTPYLHKLKGGKERILPINETIFLNTELLTKMALVNSAKNNIGHVLAQVGKPSGKMQIGDGTGPGNTQNLTWKENGKDKHLIIDTEGTPLSGIPTVMLAQSIDGYHATVPQTLLWMQKANDMLRAGVTRLPMYTLRQLIKDPASAAIIRGMEGGPVKAVFRSFKEYGKVMFGKDAAMDKLARVGLVQNNLFTGDPDDMHALARQMAGGDAPSAIRTVLNFLDKSASAANATTQLQLYNDGIKKGMSEIEAIHHARESMNFHKRGAAASIQQLNRTLVFFNSGIQAMNVMQNTLRGRMPFEDRLKTQQKFIHNSIMVFAAGFLYAASMSDDEKYRKLAMQDKLGNLHIPVGDTYIKLPISYFETGGAMWAAGQALVASMNDDADARGILKAFGKYALTAVPGGGGLPLGPGIKQVGEWATNTDFRTFQDIVPASKAGLMPGEQYMASTPESLRMLGSALNVSPIKMQHMLESLFGSATTASMQLLDQVIDLGPSARPAKEATEMPFIGGLFQRKASDEATNELYAAANDATAAKKTLNAMKNEGRSATDIQSFIADNREALITEALTTQFTQQMSKLTKAMNVIEASERMSAEEKKQRLDALKETRSKIADAMNKARKNMLKNLDENLV